jgi:hypothetical protein
MSRPVDYATALLAALLALVPAESTYGAEAARRLASARMLVMIEADGTPHNVRCLSPVAISLCPTLSKAVAGWKWEPGKRENTPAAIDMEVKVTLDAVPEGKGFALHANDIDLSVRGPSDVDPGPMTPPQYPPESMIRGKTGVIEVELFVDPGRPTYRVGRAWFNGKQARRADLLVSAAIKAAEHWPVQPWAPEQLSQCATIVFVLTPGPEPVLDNKACQDTFVEGFVAPKLLTKPSEATF